MKWAYVGSVNEVIITEAIVKDGQYIQLGRRHAVGIESRPTISYAVGIESRPTISYAVGIESRPTISYVV